MTQVLTGSRARTGRPPAGTGTPQPWLADWPWLLGDVFGVVVANLIGVGLLLGALQGARHSTDPHTLLLLLNVAAAGLIVAMAGNAVFLLTGMRQVGRLRTGLLGAPAPATAPPRPAQPAPGADPGALVAAANMTRFHRGDCPSVAGKPVVAADLRAHLKAGRTPCGLCDPVAEGGS